MKTHLLARRIIAVERRIRIPAAPNRVFAYAADLRNDAKWRAEVHATVLDTAQPGVGAVATEDAFLSAKRPHSLTQLTYVAYEPDAGLMHCATAAGAPYWMSVRRTCRLLNTGATEFVYALQFEQKLVADAIGFAPPGWFLRWYSGWMMSRYLRTLKRLLTG